METETWVNLSENMRVTHEFEVDDEVVLTFRGNGELVLSCTPGAFTSLVKAVNTAHAEFSTRQS